MMDDADLIATLKHELECKNDEVMYLEQENQSLRNEVERLTALAFIPNESGC